MKTFIYFVFILFFINIVVFSNVNAFSITEYETSTLFKDDGYEYKITYPVSEDNEWSIFYGATDSTIDKLEDGSILKTTAIISKQKTFGFGCSIEVYILNKNSFAYKNLLKSSNDEFKIIFLNIRDKNEKKYFEDIYNWSNNKNNKMLSIIYNIENNDVILFVISENAKDKKEISKDIYKIINSLTREKIKDSQSL